MTAQFAKDQVSFLSATTLSTADAPSVYAPTSSQRPSVFGTVGKWFADVLRRRAVLEELNSLSEYELADIGLTRSDIPRVFDRAFVAQRSTPHAARA